MWNENIEFYAVLARPKAGVRFDKGNEYARDLEDAVKQANAEWNGDRVFEIIEFNGISVKMVYRSLDPIRSKRTLTKHLQKISITLAYDKQWNDRVTRKEGTIFTVEFIDNQNHKSGKTDTGREYKPNEEISIDETLKQILEVLKDIREDIRK